MMVIRNASTLTPEALGIALRLGPAERQMLALMRARKSDKRIREAMMLGKNEALEIANLLRRHLECGLNQTIVERANELAIYYDHE